MIRLMLDWLCGPGEVLLWWLTLTIVSFLVGLLFCVWC